MTIVSYLVRLMPEQEKEETLSEFLIDCLEEFVVKTDNKFDDKMLLPLIKCMRKAHEIKEDEK